jgi:hypothetical protein
MILLFLVYALWYAALSITSNLSLFTKLKAGQDPKDLSGVFRLLGAWELGGTYIPNLGLNISATQALARNVSFLTLASPVASFAPALHGFLTYRLGFGASMLFGLAALLLAIWLTLLIPWVQGAPQAGALKQNA